MASDPAPESHFAFVACNPRVTRYCRQEVAEKNPDWKAAFSRPGFLTYRLPGMPSPSASLVSTFARTFGISLRQIRAESIDALIQAMEDSLAQVTNRHPGQTPRRIHLWDRATVPEARQAGELASRKEPAHEEMESARARMRQQWPDLDAAGEIAPADSLVLDVVRLDPGYWAIGYHAASSIARRWPGGIPPVTAPEVLISRAWYKMNEALMWSGLPVRAGDLCVEIGSAPGGSCQRLLEMGARVIAVDPAVLDPVIAKHPALVHLRKRGRDLAQREIAGGQWLFVDANIAPEGTIAMAGQILGNARNRIRGAILTLKMLDESLAGTIGTCLEQFRSWGFAYVKARHLAYGRDEICVVMMRGKGLRRGRREEGAASSRQRKRGKAP